MPPHRFRIVVALDRSEYGEVVLEHAIDQAARHEAPDLHFVTVLERRADADETKTWLAREVMQALDAFGNRGPDWRSCMHVVEGDPVDEITTIAADLAADLIVIGRFGVHERKGSLADRVLAKATCPTLVVNLKESVVEAHPQCPACVAVREDSAGERWFCVEHTAPDRLWLSARLPSSGPLTRGGSVW